MPPYNSSLVAAAIVLLSQTQIKFLNPEIFEPTVGEIYTYFLLKNMLLHCTIM